MTVASHIAELKRKHEHLSEAVTQAQRAPGIDRSDRKISGRNARTDRNCIHWHTQT